MPGKKKTKAPIQDVLYARISREAKQWLTKYSDTNNDLTERQIIERLIFFLRGVSEEDRQEILSGTIFTEYGRAIERLAWGNHAFMMKRWTWALQEFRSLEEIAVSAPGLKRLSVFEQAYCWPEIALQLRRAALQQSQREAQVKHYDAASKAIGIALALNQEYLKTSKPAPHRAAMFNCACCWSLLAQLTVETNLPQEFLVKLSHASNSNEESGLWREEIGSKWRDFNESRKGDSRLTERVDLYIEKVFRALNDMTATQHAGAIPKDFGFLVSLVDSDGDFLFLRSDAIASQRLKTWLREEKGKSSALDVFTFLESHVASDVRRKAAQIAHTIRTNHEPSLDSEAPTDSDDPLSAI